MTFAQKDATFPDTITIMQSLSPHRATQLDLLVSAVCKQAKVNVYSVPSRRTTDVLTFSMWGDRQSVLRLPSKILELLYNEDIEILQSGRRGINYVLIFVVTERLQQHPVARPERRAKLLNRLDRYLPELDNNANVGYL